MTLSEAYRFPPCFVSLATSPVVTDDRQVAEGEFPGEGAAVTEPDGDSIDYIIG